MTEMDSNDKISPQNRRTSIQEKYIFEVSSNRLYPKTNLDSCNNGNGPEPIQLYHRNIHRTNNSSCSSPEPFNENRLNGNSERLRDCSDDDKLDTLDRNVHEMLNANGFVSSPIDNGNTCGIVSFNGRIKDDIQNQGLGKSTETDFRPNVDVIDGNEDVGEEDSWSDEEGDNLKYTLQNYPLRRRR